MQPTKEIILVMRSEFEKLKNQESGWLHLDKKQTEVFLEWLRTTAETVGEMEKILERHNENS
jgi:hypothetical protein